MTKSFATHLMFQGKAEEAMRFYAEAFSEAEIVAVERYGAGEAGREGSVKQAQFSLGSQRFVFIDSPIEHDFDFTPSMSIFVDCDSDTELRRAFGHLSLEGETLMPTDNYGFSELFGWCKDRYGVSWQLNLP